MSSDVDCGVARDVGVWNEETSSTLIPMPTIVLISREAIDVLDDTFAAVVAEDVPPPDPDAWVEAPARGHSCDLDLKASVVASLCGMYPLMTGDFLWRHNLP